MLKVTDNVDFETNWRNKIVAVVTRDQVVDANIREIRPQVNKFLSI